MSINGLKIRDKTIFITGGTGFIGSSLIGHIIDENKIIVYDNFNRDALHSKPYANHPNLTIIKGDVLDIKMLRKVMKGVNIVVHCAGIAGIDTVIKKPTMTILVNMIGTANVLQVAKDIEGLERFVDFSTSEVFGQSAFRAEENHVTHIGTVGEARWTYAVSKLAAEHLTKAYNQEFEMPNVTLRPFNVYGPGQVGESAMRKFIQQALKNDELQIHNHGNQIRAWCYIEDFIKGLILAMVHPNAIGESFNIGNAKDVLTIYGLAQTVVRVLGSSSPIRFTNKEYADIELRVPNVAKAKRLLGFESNVKLEEGIKRTAEFFKKQM